MKYSFIIPIYNRPEELDELLNSLVSQTYEGDFEVVVIEDGSTITSEQICKKYQNDLSITYLSKPNTGPGDSRNYGMQRAQHDYFLILDSDCILPSHYLEAVDDFLQADYVDCFGGSDTATDDFTDIQKAINYTMTSLLTTGGIRGSQKRIQRFEPRSFNMGLSRKAFEATGGFGKIHPGEDPDLVIRLWEKGFDSAFIPTAFVFHKRRISWAKFRTQVSKFGQTRAILNHWHPQTRKLTFWLPTCFALGLCGAILLVFFGHIAPLLVYASYFILIGWDSARENRSVKIGFLSVWALLVQFFSYGWGFLRATLKITFVKKPIETLFPHLFFK
nr:glycosyltransferase [uncultured Capnocytophaga sp.]